MKLRHYYTFQVPKCYNLKIIIILHNFTDTIGLNNNALE